MLWVWTENWKAFGSYKIHKDTSVLFKNYFVEAFWRLCIMLCISRSGNFGSEVVLGCFALSQRIWDTVKQIWTQTFYLALKTLDGNPGRIWQNWNLIENRDDGANFEKLLLNNFWMKYLVIHLHRYDEFIRSYFSASN